MASSEQTMCTSTGREECINMLLIMCCPSSALPAPNTNNVCITDAVREVVYLAACCVVMVVSTMIRYKQPRNR